MCMIIIIGRVKYARHIAKFCSGHTKCQSFYASRLWTNCTKASHDAICAVPCVPHVGTACRSNKERNPNTECYT